MASGSKSGVYRALLCGLGLSSMVMGGRFKAGIPKSAVKGLLNQSYLTCKGTYFFMTWRLLGSSEDRRSGESEGVVKVLT